MQKKSEDFSVEEAAKVISSPAGQQLLAMLRGADQAQLQKAAELASAGDYQTASRILEQTLSSPEARALLKKMGR